MSAKKVMTLVLCMVLVAALSVAGTLAYLTSQDSVVNTMEMGQVHITMDEAVTDVYGVVTGGRTVKNDAGVQGNNYRLVPGRTYVKDPTIYVEANSEDSYLFVKVENGLEGIEADENTIAAQLTANGWTSLDSVADVYYYTKDGVIGYTRNSDDQSFVVIEKFIIDSEATNEDIKGYDDAIIEITAYAIQKAGFNTPKAAWDAAGW